MAASLSLSFTRGEPDIASNSTEVTIVVTLNWTYGTYNNNKMYGELVIDGTAYGFNANFNWNGSVTNGSAELFRKTVSVTHNDDGNKTLNYSAFFEYHTSKLIYASGSQVLPFIARTSQPSCITWPEHTQKVGDFGTEISIHTNRKASSLTHTLRYQFGSQSGTIATNVGTGTKWVIPLSLMNLIPNSTSGSGTIYCDTYSGSTKIGTASCGFTATVPASVKPSCSLTLDDVTKIDDIYGSPVQGLSRIKVTVSATTAYSSPIAAYTITANGVTYSGAEITTGLLQNSGSSPVTVTVKDQRGRTASASYTMSVQAYVPPTISELNIKRCNADGTENDKGDYIHTTFSAAISSMSSKNTATYALRYKQSTEEDYTVVNFTALANKYAVTGQTYLFAADPDFSYDIEVTATDRHSTATRATSGSTAFTLMDWKASGTGIAFGKVAGKDNTMEIALDLEVEGTTVLRGNRYSFSTPGEAGNGGYILMARIAITAANADTPITFVFSQRQKESTMTVYAQFRNSTATTSTLESIRYSGSNYGAFLVPTGSLTWDLYVQKGSDYDTVTLQDWYTSKTMEDRVDVTFPGTLVSTLPQPYHRATPAMMESLLDYLYPVGILVELYSHVSPAELFGGTWTRIENRFLWGTTSGGTIGQTGGAQTHQLTVNEMPSHNHSIAVTGGSTNYGTTRTSIKLASVEHSTSGYADSSTAINSGGGAAHNNMPPYIQVSIWRRTA
jgi:hypothetical protein